MENYKKKMLFLVGTTVLLVCLILGLNWYFIKRIENKVKLINQYQLEIRNKNLLLERINALEKESQIASQYKPLLQKALPSEAEVANFESIIKALPSAKTLNINFRFGTLTPAADNQPKSYSFNLIVSGNLNSLLKWFEEVYQLSYSFNFSQIEITQTSPDSALVNDTNKGKSININNLVYKVQIIGNIFMR